MDGSAATSVKEASNLLNDSAQAEEDLLDELEIEDIPASIREARMAHLKHKTKDLLEMKKMDHGMYNEILDEKRFLDITIAEERCVVHFFHKDFGRCGIVDRHLELLSKNHFESRFVKINVEKSKFFVAKLRIQVLPTLLCFKKGIVVDRIIGFEELGNSDDFPHEVLEKRLQRSGVIFGAQDVRPTSITSNQRKKRETDESDDD